MIPGDLGRGIWAERDGAVKSSALEHVVPGSRPGDHLGRHSPFGWIIDTRVSGATRCNAKELARSSLTSRVVPFSRLTGVTRRKLPPWRSEKMPKTLGLVDGFLRSECDQFTPTLKEDRCCYHLAW